MTFGVLTVIVLAGLAGPLLSASERVLVPVVVGELLAGLVIGRTGFDWIHPDRPDPAFLAAIGFAMLMFAAGMHVPLRQPALARGSAGAPSPRRSRRASRDRRGSQRPRSPASRTQPCTPSSSRAGRRRCSSRRSRRPACSSDSGPDRRRAGRGRRRRRRSSRVPLVLQPRRASARCSARARSRPARSRSLRRSRVLGAAGWHRTGSDGSRRAGAGPSTCACRCSSCSASAWLATRSGTSILIAGFAVGLVVAATGGPKRLSRQVTGIAQGFFIPLFFVVLGARIDVRALGTHGDADRARRAARRLQRRGCTSRGRALTGSRSRPGSRRRCSSASRPPSPRSACTPSVVSPGAAPRSWSPRSSSIAISGARRLPARPQGQVATASAA